MKLSLFLDQEREARREYEDELVKRAVSSKTVETVSNLLLSNPDVPKPVAMGLLGFAKTDIKARVELISLVDVNVGDGDAQVRIDDERFGDRVKNKAKGALRIIEGKGWDRRVGVKRELAEESVKVALERKLYKEVENLASSAVRVGLIDGDRAWQLDNSFHPRNINPLVEEEIVPRPALRPEEVKMAEFWGQIGILFGSPRESLLEHYSCNAGDYVTCSGNLRTREKTIKVARDTLGNQIELQKLLKK